jgi:hypothetical protein
MVRVMIMFMLRLGLIQTQVRLSVRVMGKGSDRVYRVRGRVSGKVMLVMGFGLWLGLIFRSGVGLGIGYC